MTDKEKLLQILELFDDNVSIEAILTSYLWRYQKDFSVVRMKNIIDELNQNHFYPMIQRLEEIRFIANERASYLKYYLSGNMWTTEEAAKKKCSATN